MRIIGGSLKGRTIFAPRGRLLRPTSEKVREALFDILQPRIVGATFFDLFAGVGAIGIEALSRGSSGVVLVEKNPTAIQFIRRNLQVHQLSDRARAYSTDALSFLARPPANRGRADLVFLDPPYSGDLIRKTLPRLASSDMIHSDSWVIVEHHHKQEIDEEIGDLRLFRQRRYGETLLSFYCKAPA